MFPTRGILLHGPPGCGKTMLAHAIAGELRIPLLKISSPEIVSGVSGESEAKIRQFFKEAKRLAPCLVFIDEIDAITQKRETAQREMERRIVAQFLTSIDELALENSYEKLVLIIGATNRLDSLDSALRRAGRFDREISIGFPDESSREKILRVKCNRLRLDATVDFPLLAKKTSGFVGADLEALTKEAGIFAINRDNSFGEEKDILFQEAKENKNIKDRLKARAVLQSFGRRPLNVRELSLLYINMDDFLLALSKVQPSARREGFATIPDVTWDNIGALKDIREELKMNILEPIRFPEKFIKIGISQPLGCLLYGPPGCGKTLLAKAIANESGASFISIKGPELLNKYVGESERSIRLVFDRARISAPCIIFFDELDALCPKRGSENAASVRVVNQLLTEMDGLEPRKQVFVIGATNRPDMIDPAMLRPGRLDKLLFVDLPSPEDRISILTTLTKKVPLAETVQISFFAKDNRCEGFSGADLAALVREASITALKESIQNNSEVLITNHHFEVAFQKVFPSVSEKDQKIYKTLKMKLCNARAHLRDEDERAMSPSK
ncbi:uncharacterized protein LOC135122244 [Zophobas morio]|uniref:uncharacterized protein LOC135122244 n=1 Tax=Zophobas morio TaxID=2755281 RepID=UPI003082763A